MEYLKEIREFIVRKSDFPKDEMEAAAKLISRLEILYIEFVKTDHYRLFKELKDLTREHEIDELEGKALTRASEVCDELASLDVIERQIKADTFSLIALNFLIKDVSKDQILGELKKESWFFKHEVLTRWRWMSAQKEAAQKKRVPFNKIYLCEVGPDEDRRNLDREFLTYLMFMPYFQDRFRKDYLIYKYNGVLTHTSPDFISINNNGDQIGIEVTEAREHDGDNFEGVGLASVNGYLGDEMEYRLINALHKRIEKKISGLKPTINPCLLVIYDNTGLIGVDHTKLSEIVENEFTMDTKTHFREIWLIDDKQGVQLFSETDSV